MAGRRIVVFGWSQSVHIQRWVAGLTERGYEIKLVSLGGPKLTSCETVVLERAGRWSYVTQSSRAVEEAKAFKPDLVHAHYATGFGLWMARARIKPCILSVWGADVVDFPKRRFGEPLVRAVLKRATHITATSQFLRHAVGELLPELRRRVTVIPFGVKVPRQVSPEPAPPPVRLCYIKSHRPKYGPHVLLKAMLKVREAVPDVRLSMAGEGEMTAELAWMATDLGLDDIVEWVGMVPNEQMYDFLQKHHIMVMPSVMPSESFGVAVLEASACGRPVVASWVGGVPEVVRRGETGLLVPPREAGALADAVVKLCRDGQLRRRLGEGGRTFVKNNYTWDRSLDAMAELYDRLIYEQGKKN